MLTRRQTLALSLAAHPIVVTSHASAQGGSLGEHPRDYPNRPIRVVVGFAAGGATDITIRTMAPKLHALLGQPMVVENRSGAGGNVATEQVVRAVPDGYTLLMGTVAALAINPALHRNLPFDPGTDLTPVSLTVDVLSILTVPVERPWRSLHDLIAAAKARPDTLTYGSSGVGSAGHLAGALLDQMAGIRTVHVPYRGGGSLITDLISGKVDFASSTAATSLPHVESGRLRALAVPAGTRSSLVPGVPTVAESGLPGYDATAWFGVQAPARTPRPIIDRLGAEIDALVKDPETRTKIAELGGMAPGLTPDGGTSPATFEPFVRAEIAKWGDVVRKSGATVE